MLVKKKGKKERNRKLLVVFRPKTMTHCELEHWPMAGYGSHFQQFSHIAERKLRIRQSLKEPRTFLSITDWLIGYLYNSPFSLENNEKCGKCSLKFHRASKCSKGFFCPKDSSNPKTLHDVIKQEVATFKGTNTFHLLVLWWTTINWSSSKIAHNILIVQQIAAARPYIHLFSEPPILFSDGRAEGFPHMLCSRDTVHKAK